MTNDLEDRITELERRLERHSYFLLFTVTYCAVLAIGSIIAGGLLR